MTCASAENSELKTSILLINYCVLVPYNHAYNARIEDDHRRSVCELVSSVVERSDGVVTNPNFE